jgi:hypothetical protein
MLEFFLKQLPGLAVGGLLVAAALIVYNAAIENPSVRAETTAVVQAANEKFTTEAINEIASNADKARAMRAYCRSIGKLYNFAKIECWD